MEIINSSNTSNYDYPVISDKLIEALERDYPDKLPRNHKDDYELGILIGQQMVIDKLKIEKKFNEEKDLKEDDTTLTDL